MDSDTQRIVMRLKDLALVLSDDMAMRVIYNGVEQSCDEAVELRNKYVINIAIDTDVNGDVCLYITIADTVELLYY